MSRPRQGRDSEVGGADGTVVGQTPGPHADVLLNSKSPFFWRLYRLDVRRPGAGG